MNPLFLLYGLLGFGVFNLMSSDSATTSTTSAPAKTPPPPAPEPEPEPEPAPPAPKPEPTPGTGHGDHGDHGGGHDAPAPAPEPQPAPPEPEPMPEPMPGTGHGDHGDHGGGHDAPAPAPEPQPAPPEPEPMPEPMPGTGHGDHGDHGGVHVGGHGDPVIAPPAPDATQSEIAAFVEAVMASPEMAHSHHGGMANEHMAAMDLVARDEATHVAVRDGDWSDPDTWFNGEVPDDDARALIPEGITVNYGTVSDARLFTVRVDGTLDFDTDTDSRMIFDTMVVSPSGALVIGTIDDPVDPDVDIDLIVSNDGPIDVDWDPMMLSRGIVAHGATSIHGAEKDSHEKVIEDPMAGDTSIRFAETPLGWDVGDTIVIAGTRYDGYKWNNDIGGRDFYPPEDEIRVITGIDENGTVSFDEPLVFDHDTPRADLKTSVANYTRNVSVETENADDAEVWERGHVMFMHSDQVDVRYAEFHELGRTDKSEESVDINDVGSISYDTNVQGRYSLHLHRTGTDDIEKPTLLIGNAVYGSPGWGYVHHDSNAVLANNASYDTFGAGYVAETGNETGAWHDNIAIFAQGISWGDPKHTSSFASEGFDTARGGEGFWFQGRMVASTDNVAASVNIGYAYFHRDGDDTMIDFDSDLFAFPEALYFDDLMTADDASIRIFDGNETFAANQGLHVVKANFHQGHDVWSHLTDFTAWSVRTGAHLEYTARYILEDFDVIAKEPTQFSPPETGIELGGSNVTDIVILNPRIEGFQTGIDLHKNFTSSENTPDLHNYFVIEPTFIDVGTEYINYDPRLDTLMGIEDLDTGPVDLDLDGPLRFNGQYEGVNIDGTKTDSLGTTDLLSADNFDILRPDMANILETVGYWTTEDGDAYTLLDLYFTDRGTGGVYSETHAIYIDDSVPLGSESRASGLYADAIDNGTQDIFESGGQTWAGDTLLDTPRVALPDPAASFDRDHAIWEALTNGRGVFSDDPEDDHASHMGDMMHDHAMVA